MLNPIRGVRQFALTLSVLCSCAQATPQSPFLQLDAQIGREPASTAAQPIYTQESGEGFRVHFQDPVSADTFQVFVDPNLVAMPIVDSVVGASPACRDSIDDQTELGPHVLCRNIASDAFGSHFYVDGHSDEIVSFAKDGQRYVRALGFDAQAWRATAMAASDGGAVFAIPTAAQRLELLAVDARMNPRWRHDLGSFANDGRAQPGAQGSARVLVRTQGSSLRIDRIAADGTLSSQANLAIAPGLAASNVSLDAAGNVFVALANPEAASSLLWRVSGEGVVSHEAVLNCDLGLHGGFSWPTPPPVCIPVSQGTHTHWLSLAADGSFSLFKTRADTTPQLAWASPDPVLSMALSSEGATLLVAEGPGTGLLPVPRLVRVGYAASERRDPAVVTPEPRGSSTPSAHLLADGLLVDDREGFASAALRRFESDGSLRWRLALAPDHEHAGHNAGQACVSSSMSYRLGAPVQGDVACYRQSDGARLLQASLAGERIVAPGVLPQHQAGRAFAFLRPETAGAATRLYQLRQGETPRLLADHFQSPSAWTDAQDRLFVVDTVSAPMRFERYDANGNHIAGGQLPASVMYLHSAMFGPQDRLWIDFSSGGDGTKQLARIAEDGSFADATRRIVSGGDLVSIDALDSGMLFMIKRTPTGGPDGSPDATLYALNADGSERWFHPAHADMPTMLAVHLSPQRVRVLEAGLSPARSWRITDLNPSTGDAVTSATTLPWPTQLRGRLPVVRARDADAFVFAGDDDHELVLVLGSVGLVDASAFADAAPAMAGVWMIPGLSGQGFVFEHNASAGVLSAAWYSHDAAQPCCDYDHSTLRWNTLAGQIVPGDSTIQTLTIFENHGGVFDEAPATTASAVGQATVSMVDCDHATLSYRFDDGRVTPRTVALLRASPRTSACSLRIPGSPGTTTTPPTYTPRSDLAGAWFEPRTSGQGLHIAIYPPSGETVTETVGLGWFTYDPAGAADESTQQHWFTASGSFDDASQQRAALTLYRTTGGDRDTTATHNTHRVGEATLERIDCASATLSYRFDDSLLAGSFALRTRVIPLQRLGGCRP